MHLSTASCLPRPLAHLSTRPLLIFPMPSITHPLRFKKNHLFVEIGGALWVYDTGADSSFGDRRVSLFGPAEEIQSLYAGQFSAADISGFLGETVAGIIGADIINRYDHIIDLENNVLTVSDGNLSSSGTVQQLDFFMGVPMLSAKVGNKSCKLFFDTGAQISYFQGEAPLNAPDAGILKDFFPMIGGFETPTKMIPIDLSGIRHTIRFGKLPGMMGMALQMAGVSSILGNEVMRNRITGYFPRRNELVLQS